MRTKGGGFCLKLPCKVCPPLCVTWGNELRCLGGSISGCKSWIKKSHLFLPQETIVSERQHSCRRDGPGLSAVVFEQHITLVRSGWDFCSFKEEKLPKIPLSQKEKTRDLNWKNRRVFHLQSVLFLANLPLSNEQLL